MFRSVFLPILLLLGTLGSQVIAQRRYWFIPAENGAPNYIGSGSVTLICPTGATLQTNFFEDSFQADNNLPNWYECQTSIMDKNDPKIISINISLAAEGYTYAYTASKYVSEILDNDFFAVTLDRIGFELDSDASLTVTFLGPSCGNNQREYIQGEDCDYAEDPNCVFCGCKENYYADYNDFTERTCSITNPNQSFSTSVPLLLGIIIPIVVIVLILIVVLRILCIRGIIMSARRRQNAQMEMEIVHQQQVGVPHQAVVVVQQPGMVPLDQGVQPGQYPNYAPTYAQMPASNPQPAYVINPAAPYSTVPSTPDPNAQPYITTNYSAQPVVQIAPNNNNNVIVVTPPPPGGAFSTN